MKISKENIKKACHAVSQLFIKARRFSEEDMEDEQQMIIAYCAVLQNEEEIRPILADIYR